MRHPTTVQLHATTIFKIFTVAMPYTLFKLTRFILFYHLFNPKLTCYALSPFNQLITPNLSHNFYFIIFDQLWILLPYHIIVFNLLKLPIGLYYEHLLQEASFKAFLLLKFFQLAQVML